MPVKALLPALLLVVLCFWPQLTFADASKINVDALPVLVINTNHADSASMNNLVSRLKTTKHHVYTRVWDQDQKANIKDLKDLLRESKSENHTSDFCLAEFAGKDPVVKDMLVTLGAKTVCLATTSLSGSKEVTTHQAVLNSQGCASLCLSSTPMVLPQVVSTPRPKFTEYYAVTQSGSAVCSSGASYPTSSLSLLSPSPVASLVPSPFASPTTLASDSFFSSYFGFTGGCNQSSSGGVAGFMH